MGTGVTTGRGRLCLPTFTTRMKVKEVEQASRPLSLIYISSICEIGNGISDQMVFQPSFSITGTFRHTALVTGHTRMNRLTSQIQFLQNICLSSQASTMSSTHCSSSFLPPHPFSWYLPRNSREAQERNLSWGSFQSPPPTSICTSTHSMRECSQDKYKFVERKSSSSTV